MSAEPQAMPQVYGLGISAIGSATNDVNNDLVATVGGDETTTGSGTLSGVLFDVPAAADPEVFRWGVGALSHVNNNVDSTVDSQVGGTPTAAMPAQIPVGLVPQVKDVTIPVLADVVNTGTDTTDVQVGETHAALIPVSLNGVGGLTSSVAPAARAEAPGPANALYPVGHGPADAVGKVTGGAGTITGKVVGGLPATVSDTAGQSRTAAPAPAAGDVLPNVQLPGVPKIPGLPLN